MKRISIQEAKLNPNFISSWIINPPSLCDNLVDYFEFNQQKQNIGVLGGSGINTEVKDTTDIRIKPKELLLPGNHFFKEYFEKLFECHSDYIKQWPFLKDFCTKYEIGSFNLQKYKPGQHFKKVHTERASLSSLHRIFVFMTYLNDVDDGGSTYFPHYDIEVKPRKGLTLIWPAEWTHAHRGNVLKTGLKYIITGWLHFSS